VTTFLVLSTLMTLNDLEAQTPKIGSSSVFLQFVAVAHADFKGELRRNGWR